MNGRSLKVLLCIGCGLSCLLFGPASTAAEGSASTKELEVAEEKRTNAYAAQLEAWLRQMLVEQYPERAAKAWHRDYTSIKAFVKSVEPNRAHWRNVIKPPKLAQTGKLERAPYEPLADVKAEWWRVPLGELTAEGIFAAPADASAGKRVPLVIVQHGIGSTPEKNFGLMDPGGAYHAYARELLKAGFAVLAPMNLRTVERRNRIERLCRLADLSLPGIELVRMQRLLDEAVQEPRVDRERVGMWGLSLGGLATMFWMPLEPRIKAGVCSGWFNHRRNKMVIPDERYSCFLETKEEHAFFAGWLIESTDSDVVALICPRPFQIQTGKADRIAHWPMVVEEFNAAREHYEKLGIADRIEMDLRDGGHETHVESGVRFLRKWLIQNRQALSR